MIDNGTFLAQYSLRSGDNRQYVEKLVSKTTYVESRECIKKAWLNLHRPELAQKNAISTLARMESGRKVGELARTLYPEGVFGTQRDDSPEDAAERTLKLMRQGQPVIFEARLQSEHCLAKVDILRKGSDGWIIDEVKSAMVKQPDKFKPKHQHDIAFQFAVARSISLPVESARIVAIDGSFFWDGNTIDASQLLCATDMTAYCESNLSEVMAHLPILAEALGSECEPEVETNTHCKGCEFHAYCHQNQAKFDVVFLPKIKSDQVTELRAEGLPTIDLIPSNHKVLTESRKKLHEAVVTGRPQISDKLDSALRDLRFPAAFIDYETCSPAIPIFPGTRPYQSLCFQWSAHLMESAESEPVHLEFLADGACDPRAEFCETLWKALKDYESIVHFSKFEISQVKFMAESGISYAADLYGHISANTFDLQKVVLDHVCFAEFLGRTSIKVVLPVLVPALSYKELEIADGDAASAAFLRIVSSGTSEVERTQLRNALRAYCKQDTLAMVEIYRALCALLA